MRSAPLFSLLLLTPFTVTGAAAQQLTEPVSRLVMPANSAHNEASNWQQSTQPLHRVFPPRSAVDLPAPISWNQPPARAKRAKVRSRSAGLGFLLGGIGVGAVGGVLLKSSLERETTCTGSRYFTVCTSEGHPAKGAVAIGLIGAGAGLAIRGILLMR
jgi:hypothetical protein